MFYPVFLDLRGRSVLVAGAGPVALRKVTGLLECGARVTVVSPEAIPEFEKLPIARKPRKFRAGDVTGQALVFAATNDRKTNQRVARAAARHGIPVNVADSLEECSFLVPSRVQRGDLQIAVSTSGRNPRIAASLRRKMEHLLDQQNEQGLSR